MGAISSVWRLRRAPRRGGVERRQDSPKDGCQPGGAGVACSDMKKAPRKRSGRPLLRGVRPRLNRALGAAVALLALSVLAAPARAATTLAAGGGPQTIVSLTFDDGTASQYWALGELSSHGMLGTFYVNSSRLGTSNYYMTWSQVHDLYAAGNEIGGHTAYHVNLPNTDPGEAKRQVCDDRVNLLNAGFQVTNFAYPFGAYNSAIEQMAQQCGYNSARTVDQQTTETMPPADPY